MAFRGTNVLSGGHGTLWIGNEKIWEVTEVQYSITANREDVPMGMSVDSKLISVTGTGSFAVQKVYSRAKDFIREWNKGKDYRIRLTVKIEDPDSVDGQIERVTLDNVWLTDISGLGFVVQTKLNETYNFGFTPADVAWEDEIK